MSTGKPWGCLLGEACPLPSGSVYICTEDAFPSRRLQQLIRQQRQLRTDVPGDVVDGIRFGDQIFIEHVADVVSVPCSAPGPDGQVAHATPEDHGCQPAAHQF